MTLKIDLKGKNYLHLKFMTLKIDFKGRLSFYVLKW